MALFEAKDLHLRFGDRVVLEDVSLSFDEGQLAGIMGPNGAGKTTCFNVLTGRYKPDRGRVTFDGRDITGQSPQEIARLGIARSFQTMNLFRPWTMKEVTELFTPLNYLMEREAESLSGGEMQMVAISRALLGAPGLVLFDEPSQGLAPKIVDDVIGIIRRLKKEGIASIVVEQNADIALSVADHAVVLSHGQVAWSGRASTLNGDPALKRQLLGGLQ